MFNWLNLIFIIMIGTAAFRGFQRGFFVEIGSLIALWLGIYAALRFSGTVAGWLQLGEDNEILAFVATFLGLLLIVHLIARALTAVIEIAMMGWANKAAGVLAAIVRSAFVISIMLNILIAYTNGALPPRSLREGSALHDPIQAFAPMVLPQLSEMKWIRGIIEDLEIEITPTSDKPTFDE